MLDPHRSGRISIIYATTSGSTKAVAEIIAAELAGYDVMVGDVRQMTGDWA